MNQWHNCPNLAAFWYNIISAVLYLYTLYTSGARYHSLRVSSKDPRYGQDWNESSLLLYLSAILLSSLFWLMFVFSSLFKTGNLANDYVEVGTLPMITGVPHINWSTSLVLKKILSRLKYHFIPFNSTMHLCGAFFLLTPIPLMIEEETQHGISNSENRSMKTLLTIYTPEIVNFVVAAVSVTVRLPTVYLTASTQISVILSFTMFIANSNILIRCLLHQLLPLQDVKYNIWEMTVTDVVLFLLTLSNYGLAYEMARTRYIEYMYRSKCNAQDRSSPQSAINATKRPNILRFWPNACSASMLIISVTISTHQYTLSAGRIPFFSFDLSTTMFHYLNWLIILLLFTFKTKWRFKMKYAPMKTCSLSREMSLKMPHLNSKPIETIYACFQPLDGVRSVSSQSSRTPNQDLSSTSSSSGSHTSEHVPSYKHIPSISKQLETPDLSYDDLPSFKYASRQGRNTLREITEENLEQMGYFKSPNISQHSSNIHSSDSGIGINYRDHTDYNVFVKSPDGDIPRSRPMTLQRHMPHEYDIHEELIGSVNICSDV